LLVDQYYGGARDSRDATLVYLLGAEDFASLDFRLISEAAIEIRGRVVGVPEGSEPAQAQPPRAGTPAMLDSGARGVGVQVSIRPAEDGPPRGSTNSIARGPEYRFQMTGFTAVSPTLLHS
jgi:hypothetical protein